MYEVYVIYDCIRKKYVSQIITIRPENPFLSIKFGDVDSAIAFDYQCLARDMIDKIYESFSKDYPEKKLNLSVRRIHA
jgi:hypothetical protein